MGLKKLAKKVADYTARLETGKASKIKPDHVREVLEKLRRKSAALETEIARAHSAEKRARLERKLDVARVQEERAEWLLKDLGQQGDAS
ncbi:hypothetical protein roselon_00340 [Roseibacterium elongatum DSM 19469]|uniref:Uncharacterized protein n=1 Tax=Roseicyclus elongatus DSM 19469 TaxID=1294273 RepID=W8SJU3_9RHOB|nr:hypothetical protein [Roseibacterium elongatum]AHM02785.1 hypothetical protein roselon_00340 [Roseibacterium elongatum DSM 19469]